MSTFIIILVLAVAAVGTVIYLQKQGKIKDADGNLIPDVVEEKVKEVKETAKKVAVEAKDVVVAAKEVAKQSKEVVKAAKGTSRKGRKPAEKK
jgi:N12 class adenine-specific DNA methylase